MIVHGLSGGGESWSEWGKKRGKRWLDSAIDTTTYYGEKGINWGKNKLSEVKKSTRDVVVKRACDICNKHSITEGDVDQILGALRGIYRTVLKELKKVKKVHLEQKNKANVNDDENADDDENNPDDDNNPDDL